MASRQVPSGQLSPGQRHGHWELVLFGRCTGGNWEFVNLGTCPPGNMSTQELAQGEFPNPALKGRTETLQMTNIPQMLAAYIQ